MYERGCISAAFSSYDSRYLCLRFICFIWSQLTEEYASVRLHVEHESFWAFASSHFKIDNLTVRTVVTALGTWHQEINDSFRVLTDTDRALVFDETAGTRTTRIRVVGRYSSGGAMFLGLDGRPIRTDTFKLGHVDVDALRVKALARRVEAGRIYRVAHAGINFLFFTIGTHAGTELQI